MTSSFIMPSKTVGAQPADMQYDLCQRSTFHMGLEAVGSCGYLQQRAQRQDALQAACSGPARAVACQKQDMSRLVICGVWCFSHSLASLDGPHVGICCLRITDTSRRPLQSRKSPTRGSRKRLRVSQLQEKFILPENAHMKLVPLAGLLASVKCDSNEIGASAPLATLVAKPLQQARHTTPGRAATRARGCTGTGHKST